MKLPTDYLQETHTDKIFEHQKYGDVYNLFMTSLLLLNKNNPLNVLEIGVSWRGIGSGHAFSRMSYVQKFVGIDKFPLKDPFAEKGIFIQGNAYRVEILPKLKALGPFHLIIDDGSHTLEDHEFVIKHYRSLLATPGILVIEDITDEAFGKYKSYFIDEEGIDLFQIRTPGMILKAGSYICNLAVIFNLSQSPIKREYKTESYYQALRREWNYLDTLQTRSADQSLRYSAFSKIWSETATEKDYDIAKRWYSRVTNLKNRLEADQTDFYFVVKAVSLGFATDTEQALVSEWYEKHIVLEDICNIFDQISNGKIAQISQIIRGRNETLRNHTRKAAVSV